MKTSGKLSNSHNVMDYFPFHQLNISALPEDTRRQYIKTAGINLLQRN
jgi:hypothetical protein